MISPLPLPDWIPAWVHVGVLLVILFFALMIVLMPFSVFGLRSRLESIDARLDEIQGEIRSLALRLPEPSAADPDEPAFHAARPGPVRPPIPPAPAARGASIRPARTEPRLH